MLQASALELSGRDFKEAYSKESQSAQTDEHENKKHILIKENEKIYIFLINTGILSAYHRKQNYNFTSTLHIYTSVTLSLHKWPMTR